MIAKACVYRSVGELDFSNEDLTTRPEPLKILLAHPEYFQVVDVKNVHMQGNKGAIDKEKALIQWNNLHEIYSTLVRNKLIDELRVLEAPEGLEDFVFAANQSFPWLLEGKKVFIPSKMRHESRQKEVPYFEKFYLNEGYEKLELTETNLFEGRGDVIMHPRKNLIYGGYGHRSAPEAYNEIAAILDVPVIALELIDDRFYHLDTCFLPVDEHTLFLVKEAFNDEGRAMLERFFDTIIEIPIKEAAENFALNAHLIYTADNKKVAIIHPGSDYTNQKLEEHGYQVTETDTSEYIKSGGSVFCMKMTYY